MPQTTTIDKAELVKRTQVEAGIAETILDATLEEISTAIGQEECVMLRNFGKFYVRYSHSSHSNIFKFDPSQRLRKILGWSSTYQGDL
jgi:DNA-binding protein HU-beta